MKIEVSAGYIKSHATLNMTPESVAERYQYREILNALKKLNVKFYQYDDMWGSWGLGIHLPCHVNEDYQI